MLSLSATSTRLLSAVPVPPEEEEEVLLSVPEEEEEEVLLALSARDRRTMRYARAVKIAKRENVAKEINGT